MAIIVQDGKWRSEYLNWCNEKGKDPYGNNMIVVIKEFLKDKENLIKSKRQTRVKINRQKKRIEDSILEVFLNGAKNQNGR